jgi:hypothetical protein
MKKKTKEATPVRAYNGRHRPEYIREVIQFARLHSNAEAIRHFEVAASTFYGWLRKPEFQAKKGKK